MRGIVRPGKLGRLLTSAAAAAAVPTMEYYAVCIDTFSSGFGLSCC
jgi:hypothetical protein